MKHNFKINWIAAIAMTAFHIGCLYALFYPTKERVLLALCIWSFGLCFGIGVCFHRLLTHQSFKTFAVVKWVLTLWGYLLLQGGAIWWVVTHKIHHRHTDKEGLDPHTPRDGWGWAHMDWMIHQDPSYNDPELLERYAPELCRDTFQRTLNALPWLPVTVFGLSVLFLYGFDAMCWAVFVPVTFGWHCTWLVNSATHLWGSQAYETGDDSRNNVWVALLTFGEGWHNNHHRFPTSARHGILWYQIDLNYYVIRFLQLIGLARDVKVVP